MRRRQRSGRWLRRSRCESAYDLTPNRLPTVTLVGRPINSSIQCVAVHGLGADLDAERASDPTPNNRKAKHTVLPSNLMAKCLECPIWTRSRRVKRTWVIGSIARTGGEAM